MFVQKARMLRCASSLVIAAYAEVRFIPRDSCALPADFLRCHPVKAGKFGRTINRMHLLFRLVNPSRNAKGGYPVAKIADLHPDRNVHDIQPRPTDPIQPAYAPAS
jgi:hypothetical protein